MIALEIKNIKEFMNQLLIREAFDSFFLEEASIVTYNTFHIDGHSVPAYYRGADQSGAPLTPPGPFSTWAMLKPFCFSLIKSSRAPVSFQITLHAGSRYMERLKSNPAAGASAVHIRALAAVIRFEDNTLKCMTGTAYDTFVMDKSIDNLWDQDFLSSLTALGIAFELL